MLMAYAELAADEVNTRKGTGLWACVCHFGQGLFF